jgi:hypothetical protein
MKIQTLDEAENIVSKSKNLSWDGWNIVHKVRDDSAEYDASGSYDRSLGKWFRRVSYPYINGTGWDIPNSLIKG